jgi:hypothetical protein
MISFFISIHFILDFAENIQETNDGSSKSNSLNVTDTNVVLETPQKDTKKPTFQKSHPLQESQSQLKDTGLFLSPATEKFHNYRQGTQVVRSGIQFRDIEGGAKEPYSVNGSHSKSRFSV